MYDPASTICIYIANISAFFYSSCWWIFINKQSEYDFFVAASMYISVFMLLIIIKSIVIFNLISNLCTPKWIKTAIVEYLCVRSIFFAFNVFLVVFGAVANCVAMLAHFHIRLVANRCIILNLAHRKCLLYGIHLIFFGL